MEITYFGFRILGFLNCNVLLWLINVLLTADLPVNLKASQSEFSFHSMSLSLCLFFPAGNSRNLIVRSFLFFISYLLICSIHEFTLFLLWNASCCAT